MNFPIVIHKDKDSDYGVTVPDLPGCFSAGATLDEALVMARQAIELHVEGLMEEGQAVPEPSGVEALRSDPRYKGGVWAVVAIAETDLPGKVRRVNITMPRRVLEDVDRFAKAHNQTRSGLLTRAAAAFVAQSRVPRPQSLRLSAHGKRTVHRR